MNKKLLLICIITILCFNINCQYAQNGSQAKMTNNINITFEKEILTSLEASLGTVNSAKIGPYLILHDSHVSARKLICIEYSTGKELWKIEPDVHRFYIYNDIVIIDFNEYIAAYQVKTGSELWRLDSVNISYNYPEGAAVTGKLLANYKGKQVILDLETQSVKSFSQGVVGAYRFQLDGDQVVRSRIGTENNYDYKGNLLAVVIVSDSQGIRRDYVWSLDEHTRQFFLTGFDTDGKKFNNCSWKMDEGERLPQDAFSGNPEPDKLVNSVFFVDGRLFLFENYINYRWSWNRGSNRINCIDWKTGILKYQKWGQNPKGKEFNTFQFFDNTILYSDNVMHFQDGDGKFSKFDGQKGKVLDSLPQKATLFRNYSKDYLLGFSYERKHIKESEYTNAVEMKLWNRHSNKFSKTFRFEYNKDYPYEPVVFSEDGLVILYYYLKDKNRSMLRCYRVTEK